MSDDTLREAADLALRMSLMQRILSVMERRKKEGSFEMTCSLEGLDRVTEDLKEEIPGLEITATGRAGTHSVHVKLP